MLPVNEKSFWKERLVNAEKNGRLHYSVYIARDQLWENILKAHLEIFKKEIKKTDYVLDGGCGYGRMAKYFDPGKYIGVDLSPDLLEIARDNFPNHEFLEGDLSRLPFQDKEIDVVFCISIRQMIVGNLGKEVWTPVENEIARVAKKVLLLEYENPHQYTVLGRQD